jgi:formylglycine-generating enzyme required for sulfatase activity
LSSIRGRTREGDQTTKDCFWPNATRITKSCRVGFRRRVRLASVGSITRSKRITGQSVSGRIQAASGVGKVGAVTSQKQKIEVKDRVGQFEFSTIVAETSTPSRMGANSKGNLGLVLARNELPERIGTIRVTVGSEVPPIPPPRFGATLTGSKFLESSVEHRTSDPDQPTASTDLVAEHRRTTQRQLEREVRGEMDWVTMKALEKDRVRRYSSASEFAADVRRVLRNEPVLAGPPSTLYRLRKYYRRQRVPLLSSVVVVVLLGVIAVGTWQASTRRERAADELRSRQFQELGAESFTEYRDLRGNVQELEGTWRSLREKDQAMPIWQRSEEIVAWERYSQTKENLDRSFNDAVLFFSRAVDAAPPGSTLRMDARRALEDAYFDGYQQALQTGGVHLSPSFFRSMVDALELDSYDQELQGMGQIIFESESSGADVFCFRYETHEQRRVPLPYLRAPTEGPANVRSQRRVVAEPFLKVERVRQPAQTPFQRADRLLTVNERPVHDLSELAAALSGVELDGRIRARFTRPKSGKPGTSAPETVTLDWRPFPSTSADNTPQTVRRDIRFESGKLVAPFDQLGVSFRGYPLSFEDACRIGRTRDDTPLKAELPPGSYLFVLRKAGYRDTRYPVAIPPRRLQARVRLLATGVVAQDLVHVPAGPVAYGGDPKAFQGRAAGEANVGDFLIGRTEVRVRDYLAFVNDPAVFARTELSGKAAPISPAGRRLVSDTSTKDGTPPLAQLIPRSSEGSLYWQRDATAKVWQLRSTWDEEWPVMGVSHVAALEYAHWLTIAQDGTVHYRLPTDLEWEKAARGVDRKLHVWGDYFVADFCISALRRSYPGRVAVAPLDESPYGVRDLAGSVEEPTSGLPAGSLRYRSVRGGSWNVTDEFYFRCATRNGMLPFSAKRNFGIRLAADLPAI